jgi:hypothetical protein
MQRVMRARVWRTGVHLFMTKKLLIDASHAEETRVVVLDGNRLEDFDVETATRKQIKGNIYLAKVIRVEPMGFWRLAKSTRIITKSRSRTASGC